MFIQRRYTLHLIEIIEQFDLKTMLLNATERKTWLHIAELLQYVRTSL